MVKMFRVTCSGELHTIKLIGDSLVLADHGPEDFVLARLGGQTMDGCLHVLEAWRSGSLHRLPVGLRAERWARMPSLQEYRERSANESLSFVERMEQRIRQAIMKAVREHTVYTALGGYTVYPVVEVGNFEPTAWLEHGTDNLWMRIYVRFSWLTRVWKRKLATVDGLLVLDARDRELLVVYPCGWLKLETRWATFERGKLRFGGVK